MASSKPEAPKANKIMIDIAKPGKSAPDASTRPLIVGHRPLVKDPMMSSNDVESTDEEKAATNLSPSRSAKIVAPMSSPEEAAPVEDATEGEADPSPAEIAMLKEHSEQAPAVKDELPAEEDDTKSTTAASSDAAAVDVLAEHAANRQKAGTISEEEIAKAQAIHKLIEERTYHVPISKAHHSRNTAILAALVIILAIVGAVMLANRAGMINLDPSKLPV